MKRVLIAVTLPILVLLGWAASLEFNQAIGAEVRLRVQGYDPRDLLAGHYIRYALKLDNACADHRSETCVCLEPEEGGVYHHSTWAGSCSERASSCKIFLRGSCAGWQFTAGVERFSIPEALAPVLQTVPGDSSVVLSITPAGSAQVVRFYVGEETVEQYAARKLAERRSE